MIVIDTNVISEALRLQPSDRVVTWLDDQTRDELYLATPVLAEVLFGIALMPEGRRRQSLESATPEMLDAYFGPRVLSFDEKAATSYASIVSSARKLGRAMGVMDAQIAAIAQAAGASVATRDTAPFMAAGITTINPWTT